MLSEILLDALHRVLYSRVQLFYSQSKTQLELSIRYELPLIRIKVILLYSNLDRVHMHMGLQAL